MKIGGNDLQFDTTTWHNYFLENKIDVKVDFDSILLSK
jgi:hypothetical protein